MDEPPSSVGSVVRSRRWVYGATSAGLLIGYVAVAQSPLHGNANSHALTEAVATVLALSVGCLALVRYYSRRDTEFLFVGTGFVIAGVLDGFHTVVSAVRFVDVFPSSPPSLQAWSWLNSRLFLSVLLWLSWLFWRRAARRGGSSAGSERTVYGVVATLAIVASLVAFVPLPAFYLPALADSGPLELLPALFFLLASIGYFRKGEWARDAFEHCLVLSLIVGFIGQAVFMPSSDEQYDAMFAAAHLLKIVEYAIAMTGLLFSTQRLFSESIAQRAVAFTNTLLTTQQEAIPDALLVVDAYGRVLSCNRHFIDLWGLSRVTVSAGTDAAMLRSVAAQVNEPERFAARVAQLYERRSEVSREEIGLLDGRILDRYSAPIAGAEGTYYGRLWVFRDITERKRAEQAIADERRFSDTVIASMPDPFAVIGPAGIFVRWNDPLRDLFGLSDAQMATTVALDTVYESDRAAVATSLAGVAGQGPVVSHSRLVTTLGVRDFRLKATTTLSAGELYLVAVATDVTEAKRAEEALRESEKEFRTMAESMPQIVWITRPDGWNVYSNQQWADYTGLTPEQTRGVGWFAPVHVDDRQRAAEAWQDASARGGIYAIESRLRRADGAYRWWLIRGVPMKDADGAILKWFGTSTDIHDMKMAELEISSANRELRESRRRFSDLLDTVELASVMLDRDGRITYCNDYLLHLSGWQRDDVVGRTWVELFMLPEMAEQGTTAFTQLLGDDPDARHHDAEILTRSGERRLVRWSNTVLRSGTGEVIGTASIGDDITERRRADERVLVLQGQLLEQSVRDPLTGLYNRRYLDEAMAREIPRAIRSGRPLSVIICDLDEFKLVNDVHGHLVGDEVLRVFADLLKSTSRASDIVCRYGGEEFLLLLAEMPSETAIARAEQLRSALAALRVPCGSGFVRMSVSCGVASCPQDATTADALIRAADEALYEAKRRGRDQVVQASATPAPQVVERIL